MVKYDVFKSQGGYAVALGIYLDCPVVGAMQWFETEAEATQYAQNHKAYCNAYAEQEEKIKYLSLEELEMLKFPSKEDYNLDIGVTI